MQGVRLRSELCERYFEVSALEQLEEDVLSGGGEVPSHWADDVSAEEDPDLEARWQASVDFAFDNEGMSESDRYWEEDPGFECPYEAHAGLGRGA